MPAPTQVTTVAPVGEAAVRQLRTELRGELLRPGDAGYDPARRLFNAMIDKRPALIARCTAVADVVHAIRFAREHDLPLAVRGGGHNVAGKALCDDGLVVDLSPMKEIRLDPDRRTVTAGPGLTWGEFDRATQAAGLATTGGFISTTGVAGLTLGGGLGWLMRAHGLTCDNLRGVEIVTADGEIRRASAAEHEDLFWAVRGGGGNFGVVTSFDFALHPVGPMLAGVVFHPAARAREVLRFYRDFMAGAPEEVMAYGVLTTSPDGVPVAAIPVCYVGPLEAGERALEPVRRFGTPLMDTIGPMSYCEIQTMFDAAQPFGRNQYWKSSFLRALDDDALDVLVDHFERVTSPFSMIALEPFGGAVARVPEDATAFAQRKAPYSLVVLGTWEGPREETRHVRWTRDVWSAMQPWSSEAAYVNYLDADDAGRVAAAYGASFRRLAEVKRKYDPGNLFRENQNISPGG